MDSSEIGSDVITVSVNGSFTLEGDDDNDIRPKWVCIGWRFRESLDFKDGRSVEAEAVGWDGSDEGRRHVKCTAHEILYNECVRQGIPYMHRDGECKYTIDELKAYNYTGPTCIRGEG
jgi:hypothetical protein